MNPYKWEEGVSTPSSVETLYGVMPDWKGAKLSPSICLASIYAGGNPFYFLTKDILFYFKMPHLIHEERDRAWIENEIFRRGIKNNGQFTHPWWRGSIKQACRFSWQLSYYHYAFNK